MFIVLGSDVPLYLALQNSPFVASHSLLPQVQVPLLAAEPSVLTHTGVILILAHLFNAARQKYPLAASQLVLPQAQSPSLIDEPSVMLHTFKHLERSPPPHVQLNSD